MGVERFERGPKMKNAKRKSRRNRRGMVLPFVVAIGLVLAILGLGLIQLGFGSRLMAAKTTQGVSARAAADGGLARALREMNLNYREPATFPWPTNGAGALDNTTAGVVADESYVFAVVDLGGGYYRIDSTGTSGREQRTVHAMSSMTSRFEYALFVTNNITFREGTTIDGYDTRDSVIYGGANSGLGVQIGSNTSEARQGTGGTEGIELKSGVTVIGDVAVGAGAEPEEVIEAEPGQITGSTYAMGEPYDWAEIEMPTAYDISLSGTALSFSQTTETIGIGGTLTPLGEQIVECVGTMTIGNSGMLEVNGDVRLHVTGDLNLGQSAGISVMASSSLWIYLDGAFDSTQSNILNNTTMYPANFILYGTGTEEVNWDIGNSGVFYGVIYAPNANLLVREGGDIYGAVAGRSADLSQAGNLRYDMALANPVIFPAGYVIDRWWEAVGPAP
jgi:hypothetical protein